MGALLTLLSKLELVHESSEHFRRSLRLPMAYLYRVSLLLVVHTFVSLASGTYAAETAIPSQHHCWGRFKPGSWKTVRVRTENLDAVGNVASTSITETTATLTKIDGTGYTLRIKVIVEVAGRQYDSEPKTTRVGFSGETDGQSVSLKSVGNEEYVVSERNVPCEVREVVINGGDTKRVTQLHYSSRLAPHVLRRTTVATRVEDGSTDYSSKVETLAVDMPYRILTEMKSASFNQTVVEHAGGKSMTLEVHCMDVPGGVVSHTSKEIDNNGTVVRRSTLELVDYYVDTGESEPVQTHWLRRRWRFNRRPR
jgi:hypothetical protein